MKLKHMEVLREIQDICQKETCKFCKFYDGGGCLFLVFPMFWVLDKFEVEE